MNVHMLFLSLVILNSSTLYGQTRSGGDGPGNLLALKGLGSCKVAAPRGFVGYTDESTPSKYWAAVAKNRKLFDKLNSIAQKKFPNLQLVDTVNIKNIILNINVDLTVKSTSSYFEVSTVNYEHTNFKKNLDTAVVPKDYLSLSSVTKFKKSSSSKRLEEQLEAISADCLKMKPKSKYVYLAPFRQSSQYIAVTKAEMESGLEEKITERRATKLCKHFGYSTPVKIVTLASTVSYPVINTEKINNLEAKLNTNPATIKMQLGDKYFESLECSKDSEIGTPSQAINQSNDVKEKSVPKKDSVSPQAIQQ